MITYRVTRRAGVRIPGLGSRRFDETFEVDKTIARDLGLDKRAGLERVDPAPPKATKPAVEKDNNNAS